MNMTETIRHVLIVEDELLLAEFIKQDLEDAGYRVSVAPTVSKAEAYLSQLTNADAIVTDYALGEGENGLQLAVKARQLLPNVQIICMSGYCYEVGLTDQNIIDAVLNKPFEPDALLMLLAQASSRGGANLKG